LGWAAEASLRAATASLCELGALERNGSRPPATQLTAAGRDLLGVADALERWLSRSDFGALELPDPAARGTIGALVAGWDSTVVQALATRPRRLADLRAQIATHSYPALKRRLAKMRGASLVMNLDEGSRSPELKATPFLRHAAAPLVLAVRWERNHMPDVQRSNTRDLETLLLLALPLVELSSRISGSCVLAVLPVREPPDDDKPPIAKIRLAVASGRIALLPRSADHAPRTWVAGSVDAWLGAMTEGRVGSLPSRGSDLDLAADVVSGLHRILTIA
jgi:DNA-binding HxlR family transcriptional regulator